ncbi:hypothetical protein PoHVEF18_002941 [Penicillium ochrochloron]
MEPVITNPVLPPNLPVTFCFDEEIPHRMLRTDRLISFQSAYKLRVAEEDHRVALEALIAGLKQELAKKDELIARLQAELDTQKRLNGYLHHDAINISEMVISERWKFPLQYAQNIIAARNTNMVKPEGHVSAEGQIADLKRQLKEKDASISRLQAQQEAESK